VQPPRLARVDNDEADLLIRYRILAPEDQCYIKDLIESLVARRLSSKPANVYLLADPKRKFACNTPPPRCTATKPEVA
jgi:hypothetical protein